MKDNVGTMFLKNGRLCSSVKNSDVEVPASGVVYEVIRIINKTPLFLEDHYQRLENSMNMLGMKLQISFGMLFDMIKALIAANCADNCNVKLLVYNNNNDIQESLLYICRSYYPSRDEYLNGVPVSLFYRTRPNPNAKVADNSYKEAVAAKIASDKVFEVILVNNEGYLTEGSRSNLFIVSGNVVYTAPDSYVLKGITRRYVIDACRDAGFYVLEELFTVNDLEKMDGLFLSGTSIKVLPISNVEKHAFPSADNPVIKSIARRYDNIIDEYIKKHSYE